MKKFFLFFYCLVFPCTGVFPQAQTLPDLTGSYPVGTVLRHFIDTSRDNPFTEDPGDYRELMVQIWYPSQPVRNATPLVYMPDADVIGVQARAIKYPFPQEMEDFYLQLPSHSILNEPISDRESSYPLLIFSHANSSINTQNVYQMEELASHGYVVASIAHTYNSLSVRFLDGRVIDWNADSTVFPDIFYRHAQDIRFVLDRLTALNEDDLSGLLTHKLDLSRVGVLGMSVGGAAAALSMQTDSRFQAGINMDGTLCYKSVEGVSDFTDICDSTLNRPFLIFLHEGHNLAEENTDPRLLFHDGGLVVTVADTAHYDFSEFPMIWMLAGFGGIYPASESLNPLRVVRVFTDYTLAFFNRYLNGIDSPILHGSSVEYPETAIEVYEPEMSSVMDYSWYR